MNLVFRYRVKSLNGLLNRQARTVNFVWNYCNDRQKDALSFNRAWLSGFDLVKLCAGSSKELQLYSDTVNDVCQQYAKSRSQLKRPYLRYRGIKSTEWIPLKGRPLKREGDAFRFRSRNPIPSGRGGRQNRSAALRKNLSENHQLMGQLCRANVGTATIKSAKATCKNVRPR